MSSKSAKSHRHWDLRLEKDVIINLLNQLFICEFSSKELRRSILQLKNELNLISDNRLPLNWVISKLSRESQETAQKIHQFLEKKTKNSNHKFSLSKEDQINRGAFYEEALVSNSNISKGKPVHIRIAEAILSRKICAEEATQFDHLLEDVDGNVGKFADQLFNADEYKSKKNNELPTLPHLSNAEYIIYLFNGILGRFPTIYELWGWSYHHLIHDYTRKQAQAAIQSSLDPLLLQNNLILETFGTKKILDPRLNEVKSNLNHSSATIMGTDQYVTVEIWNEIKSNLFKKKRSHFAESARNSMFYKKYKNKTSNSPSLSIITSLYNGDKFIKSFMENMVNQMNFHDYELIIIDACSPGEEYTIIKEYIAKYPNIVYHRCKDRISIYEAWNLGVSVSRGKYLTNANLDDIRAPYGLSMQVECLERFPSFDICYGDFYYYFEANPSWKLVELVGIKSSLTHISPGILISCNYPHCAPLWRKKLHEEVGLFDTKYASAADWEFWLRCIKARKNFYFIPIPLSGYYQNPEGISTSSETKGIEEVASITNKYFKDLIMTDDSTLMISESSLNQLHFASRSLPRRSHVLLSYIESQSRYRNLNSTLSFVPIR